MSCFKQNMLKKAANLTVLVIGYSLYKMYARIYTHTTIYAHKNTAPGCELGRTACVMVPV